MTELRCSPEELRRISAHVKVLQTGQVSSNCASSAHHCQPSLPFNCVIRPLRWKQGMISFTMSLHFCMSSLGKSFNNYEKPLWHDHFGRLTSKTIGKKDSGQPLRSREYEEGRNEADKERSNKGRKQQRKDKGTK